MRWITIRIAREVLVLDTELADKVVLITGASGGIGRACAEAFAEEGARLVLHGHQHYEAVADLAQSLPSEAIALAGNIGAERDVVGLFKAAADHFGRLDVVVANAGVWPPRVTPIQTMTVEQWNDTVTTNLTGTFLCAREYFRYLERARPASASLVIIGSTAAIFGEADHADYAASKAGTTFGLTKTLKNEIVDLVPRGRVNAVCPGWTLTRMAEDALKDHDNVVPTLQTRPLKRIARATDIAGAVVFLASDRLAGHITGEVLTIAGGMEGRILHRPEDIDPTKA